MATSWNSGIRLKLVYRVFVSNDGVTVMRSLVIAATATFLLLPLGAPANACGAKVQALASATDYSAAAKKKPVRKPRVKVEYMRAAPMK